MKSLKLLRNGLMLAAALGFALPAMAAHWTSRSPYLQKNQHAGTPANGQLEFSGKRITIPFVAGVGGAAPKRFELHGMVDPTLVVPAGAHIRIRLANAESSMPHGLAVTTKAPPYPANVKSEIKPPLAGTGYVDPTGSNKGMHVKATGWFTLKPGTYYYVCPVPTHASDGMYGKIIVQASGG